MADSRPAAAPRIALTTGPVSVPPTYFVVQHALALAERYRFALFSPRTELEAGVALETHSAVHRRLGPRADAVRLQLSTGQVRRALDRWRPELVHQHFATWSIPAAAVSERRGVPLVTTLHGYDVYAMTRQSPGVWGAVTRRNLRANLARTTRYLAVSEWLAGRAVQAGVGADRIDVLYQGVDTTWFSPGPGESAGEPPVVLFAGGLVVHKGIRELVEASIAVIGSVPHTLAVAGSGPLAGFVDEAAARHPHIRRLGPLGRVELRDAYRSARVGVVPSLSTPEWSESAGLVALEAQASGTPVVVTGGGGLPEMVRADRTGTVVPPGDVGALAAALRDWIELPAAAYDEHSAAAVTFVRRERDATRSASRLADRYDALLSR